MLCTLNIPSYRPGEDSSMSPCIWNVINLVQFFYFLLTIYIITVPSWFMGLTFLDSVQYGSLQHWTSRPPPSHPKLGIVHFGFVPSSFLESFLHSNPRAYWAPTDLGSPPFSVMSFWLFKLFMGFSRQECWSGLPIPSPVNHVLSELSTVTHLSWMAWHSMAHSFTEF